MSLTAHRSASSVAELGALRASVAEFLAQHSPESAVRRVADAGAGHDTAVWQRLCRELGVLGLLVPDERGGAGCGFAELAVVLSECGRALYPGPVLASSVAVWALAQCADDAVLQDCLPALADGDRIATVALDHAPGAPPGTGAIRATGTRLTGQARHVLDAHLADLLVVEALTSSGVRLFLVDVRAAGVSVTQRAGLDPTRRLSDVAFDDTPGRLLEGAPAVAALRAAAAVAVASSQVGGGQAALGTAVDYAKVRNQFGRPIGSFQAIKHQCADVLLAIESAHAAVRRAARGLDEDDSEVAVLAGIAKATASDAYVRAAETNIQVHGGIGFTWEHPAHLHLRRAKTDELLFGNAAAHRRHIAALLGLSSAEAKAVGE